jgi:pseudouridine synthase
MRLNAYLARAGVSSRRGADKLITDGRVRVNDKIGQLNDDVTEADIVELDGQPIEAQKLRYILLYKPAGTVTTLADPEGRPTVTNLIKIPERIVPVGRLDYDSTGALLLTNDGELANRLMHPSFEIDKIYEVSVTGHITQQILNKLRIGIDLDDGKTAPAKVKKISEVKIELTIHEGKKRQVKRMIKAVGLKFVALHRSGYGPLNLNDLEAGQWRELTPKEISQLKML